MAPEELRERIGTVFQDYMTYDLTAAENIGLGDLPRLRDSGRVREAAVQAGIDDHLKTLPRGYDTLLSRVFFDNPDTESTETGVYLSGGQWQRLAIARGFMRADRDLLILDEPSSGMDAEAEHALHRRLYDVREGRTTPSGTPGRQPPRGPRSRRMSRGCASRSAATRGMATGHW
jgi:ATP-binding cassette, subfamily B, bacterial